VGKLTIPCLALVTDRRLCRELSLEDAVAQAIEGGANLVQLREKDLPAADLLALAEKLRAVTRDRALFLVNDRLDVALASTADGVHLPEQGLPVAAARRLVPSGFVIGRSVHSVAEALRAQEEGADYVQVGTIFASRSHHGQPVAPPSAEAESAERTGLALLEAVAAAVTVPILAVGGITATNVGDVMRAGASGAAVISAVLGAPSPREAARALAQAMAAAPAKANR
jgi:thiamine-phosphate pyrophosphorylase